MEHFQTTPSEFKDLCYLLTSKSVQDAPSFKTWEGIGPARERLAEQFQSMVNFESMSNEESVFVEPQRLLKLLQQAGTLYECLISLYYFVLGTLRWHIRKVGATQGMIALNSDIT